MDSEPKPPPAGNQDYVTAIVGVLVGGLAAAWIALAWYLLSRSQVCMPTHPNAGLIARFLACREPNQIGDFLAGFFAPLATLLVGFAVFIQMRELKAQQTELHETKLVFIHQSSLMKAQIAEAQRSADLLEKQNNILQDQDNARKTAQKWAEFHQWLVRIRTIAVSQLNVQENILIGTYQNGSQGEFEFMVPLDLPEDTEAAVATFVRQALLTRRQRSVFATVRVKPSHRQIMDILNFATHAAITLADNDLGSEGTVVVGLLQLRELKALLDEYRAD